MNDDKGMQRIGQMGLAQFEPRDFTELEKLARMAAASKLFAVQSVEAAIVIMLTGASLGIPPVVAMRSIHVVQGRAVLSSDLIHALVRRSGFCVTWAVEETTAEKCTITTQRRGEPLPYTHSWTAAMARTADLANKATWRQYPAAMLRARCTAEIARIVYPDVLMAGVYCEGEVEEDDAPTKPESETRRPAIEAQPSPLALPRDNGPGPSGKPLPAAEAPIVEAPPVALPLSANDLRAMLDELTSATDLAALRAAWKGMADDEKRGTEEQRAALLDAATKRKAVFAEEARLREERKAAADEDESPNVRMWNAANPVGTRVAYWSGAKRGKPTGEGETIAPAANFNGTDCVRIARDGKSSDVMALTHVAVIVPTDGPRGPRKARTPVAPADATGGGAEGADGPVDAPGARSSSGHPMTTRAERLAHLATLPLAETVRLSWRHRAAMPPPHYREDCALRVCALTHGFGVEDALAYLDAAPLRVVASQPKTRAA